MKRPPFPLPPTGRVLLLVTVIVALGVPASALLTGAVFSHLGWDLPAAVLAALVFAPLVVCAGLGWALWRWATVTPQPLLSLHRRLSVACLLTLSWPLWSGILAFYGDLSRPWLDPAVAQAWQHTPRTFTPSDTLSALEALDHSQGIGDTWTLMLPSTLRPFYIFSGSLGDAQRPSVLTITAPAADHPALAAPWNSYRADALFRRVHTDFLMPKPVGRFLAGIGGLFMAIVVLSGLFAHRQALRDAWRWRRHKPRIALADGHKRLGLWIVPYLLVMGLTGAVLGMKVYSVPVAALGLSGFDPAVARQALRAPSTAAPPQPPLGLQACLASFRAATPGWDPGRIQRRGNHMLFEGSPPDSLAWAGDGAGAQRLSCDLGTAKITPARSLSDAPWTNAVESALRPIHYGRFGGVGIALLYCLLGLLAMWVVDSGIRLLNDHRIDRAPLALRLQAASNALFLALPWLMLVASLVGIALPPAPIALLCGLVGLWFCLPLFDRTRQKARVWAWRLGGFTWAALPPLRWILQGQAPSLGITAVGDLSALALAGWMIWKSAYGR